MRKISIFIGALLGSISALAAMALLYLGDSLAGLLFVPFDIFDWLARTLPGDIITLGIDTIVNLIIGLNLTQLGSTSEIAKLTEQLMALALFVGLGVVLGGVVAWVLNRWQWPGWQVGGTGGFFIFLFVLIIESGLGNLGSPLVFLWLAIVLVGWGALLGHWLHSLGVQTAEMTEEARRSRRSALVKMSGGSIAMALAAWGLGSLFKESEASTGAGQPLDALPTTEPQAQAGQPTPTNSPAATATSTPQPTQEAAPASTEIAPSPEATSTPQPTATVTNREKIEPAPGTRSEITDNEDFYRIDINTRPVTIDRESWMVEVEGLFDNARPLTLADLMAYPAITHPLTLSCISNRIGGDLISASNWTGARLRDVLQDLGIRPEAQELYIEAADGFYESVAMEDMMDPRVLLVYGMNGETLPVEHGFPLRIYIPNRYGMKQPKWITRIEAIDEQGPGYWVDRGWSAKARPRIISMIDTVATNETVDGRIPVGGIAWAGDRGIEKVEVRVDDGDWVEAALRTPPLSQLIWVQWRYDWPGTPGEHTFTVRATDGTGALQIGEEQPVRPDGATGYHSVTVTV